MIKSMTGYGRAEGMVGARRLAVEVKAVNHRFLNFFAKLPGDLQRYEGEVLGLVKSHLQRGQVNVFVAWDGAGAEGGGLAVNLEVARGTAEVLRRVALAAGLPGEVRLEHLLAVPGGLGGSGAGARSEELWSEAAPVVEAALKDLDRLRQREGADLDRDVRARLEEIEARVLAVEARRPQVLEECRQRLHRRVQELVKDLPAEVVADRVALEVVLFADRSDVSEEVVRLRSHLDKFRELLAADAGVGRKLDFLLQEMNREVNTIGSKCADADASRLVVEVKAELEKIREQIQNVE